MKAFILLLALALTTDAISQAKPVSMKGQADSAYQLPKQEIQVPNKQYTNLGGLGGLIESENDSILSNPGFEASTYSSGWTLGGTGTHAAEISTLMFGKKAARVDTAAQTLSIIQDSTLYASQFATSLPQGYVRAWIYNTASGATLCARSAGVTLSGNNCVTLQVKDGYVSYEIPVVLGGTSNGLEVSAPSTTGVTLVDRAYVGVGAAMPEVAQAQLAGRSYILGNASCLWTRTNTALGAFTTDANCVAPTLDNNVSFIGSWQTTDANLPQQTINDLPPGNYRIKVSGYTAPSVTNASSLAISDGTRTCVAEGQVSTTDGSHFSISCPFIYTATGNRTFAVHGQATTGQVRVSGATTTGGDRALVFELEYYPPASKVYSSPCSDPRQCENEFSFSVSLTGVVSEESLDIINGNCSVASTNQFTCNYNTGILSSAMNCVVSTFANVSATSDANIVSSSSTTLVYQTYQTADAVARAQAVKIICQKQGADYKATNIINGTFKDVVVAPGMGKPKDCGVWIGGTTPTLAAPTNCTAGSCTEFPGTDNCGAFTAPTFSSTGFYINATIANGTYAASSEIDCSCTAYTTTTGATRQCHPLFVTGDNTLQTNASGGWIGNFATYDVAGGSDNTYFKIKCRGVAP